jgi:predicted acylesterase/phospholipase RssA
VGWTEAGTRPEFTFVTGISTGALTAPFAFLGPDYDDELKEIYTTYSTSDLLEERGLLKILKGDAAASTDPLKELLATYVDEAMMQRLAEEHRRGRQLNIGTTNLDVGRPVVWNVTKIAASGHPRALELIRQIMLASAAIPAAFPPVYIEVERDGLVYDEMHVDGGVTAQVFFYPADVDMGAVLEKLDVQGTPRLYLIRNSWIEPEFVAVEPRVMAIAGRSVSTLIRAQGIGDMYRLFMLAGRDGIDYNLAYIPDTFHEKPTEEFDAVYMGKLFDLGYDMARDGYPWQKLPPGFEVP